jgi:TrmH family RNA methyltransferase
VDGLISSVANPTVKRMRLLADKKHRRQSGAAVVHGIQPVWQAVEAGFEVETLVVAPDLLRNEPATRMVAEQERRGVRITRVTRELFERLADRDGPSGLAAIIRQRFASIDEFQAPAPSTFVALHRIANPGNLGTIIRTADATGVGGVILIGQTADPYDPAAIKASMGAIFSVPIAAIPDVDTLLSWAGAHQVAVATTAARADSRLWQTDYPSRLAILMGSEGSGLDDRDLERGDLRISIPMVGTAESLNLAVATAVLLYDVWRQRVTASTS